MTRELGASGYPAVVSDDQIVTVAKTKKAKFPVVCLECGKLFSSASWLVKCPKCGGSDIEPR